MKSSQKIINVQDLTVLDEIPSEIWNIKEGEENIVASKIPTYKWFGLIKTEYQNMVVIMMFLKNQILKFRLIKKEMSDDKTTVLSTIKNKIKKKVDANVSNTDGEI